MTSAYSSTSPPVCTKFAQCSQDNIQDGELNMLLYEAGFHQLAFTHHDVSMLADTMGGKIACLPCTSDMAFVIGPPGFGFISLANIKLVTQCTLYGIHHPHILAGKMFVKWEAPTRNAWGGEHCTEERLFADFTGTIGTGKESIRFVGRRNGERVLQQNSWQRWKFPVGWEDWSFREYFRG